MPETDHTRRQAARADTDRPRNRGIVILPNGFTLANLFFGMFAIVSASRGEFDTAGLYVVFGGVCDALDGRVARATGTGSRFGSELDSLVDAITFGLAPAMIATMPKNRLPSVSPLGNRITARRMLGRRS